jgi:hypothetical protein
MNRDNKQSMKSAKIWQRHTLAQACFLVVAGVSTAAWAVDPQDGFQTGSGVAARVTYSNFGAPGTDDSQGLFWATGYNNQIGGYQYGSGQVEVTFGSMSLYQQSPAGPGAVPTAINNNSFLSYSYGNQQTLARSLSLLNRTSSTNDGQLALNLQVLSAIDADPANSTQILSSMMGDGRSVYINQDGNASANQSVSGNTFGATTISNLMDTSLSGALPFLYDSDFKGQSSLTYTTDAYFGAGVGLDGAVDPDFFRGTRGGVNITNIQSAFNTAGMAIIEDTSAKITVAGTTPVTATVGVFADNINLNDNSILAKSTINSATSIVQASAASSAFSGSIAVTNGQNNQNTNTSLIQTASVQNAEVMANVQGVSSETRISGTLNVNGNTISATASGNAAGERTSTGTIAAGNAIVFDGSADIQGPIGSKPWTDTLTSARKSLIYSDQSDNNADLLINSAQRNSGNQFLASVSPTEISSTADNLAGGAIAQNGNTQSATVSGNLVGNLITAGGSASIGNILSNAAIVSSQENKSVTSTATVGSAVQKVSVGLNTNEDINGTISLNNNTLQATAEGNAASSDISLKASTLSVGQGVGSVGLMTPNNVTETEYWGSSFAAVSVLNAQKNTALSLTSNLENSSVSAEVKIPSGEDLSVTGSQISVNGNSLLSSASGNAATNSVSLTAGTAPSLNAGLGNTQFNSGNVLGDEGSTTFAGTNITANAGKANALAVGFSGKDVTTASSVSLNTNSIGATAKGSSATNTLSVTADNASGATNESKLFSDNAPGSIANDPNTFSGVQTYADLGLGNAQAARGTTTSAVVDGSVTGTVAAVTNSSLTANSNSVSAAASLNSATNSVALNMGNMSGMTAGLTSAQTAANSDTTVATNAAATAQANGAVTLTTSGAVTAVSSLTLSSNTVSASASANTVSNALSLTGTTASGRDSNWTAIEEDLFNVAGASNNTDGSARADADFAVANKQNITASGANTATSKEYSAQTTSTAKAVVGGALTDSSITLNGNNTLARASGNDASNTIGLEVDNLSKPNTALASMQTMDTATFKATVTDADRYFGTGVSVTGATSNAQLAVTNNLVKASALGNVVTNSVTMKGTNLTGSTSDFNQPLVSTSVVNVYDNGDGLVTGLPAMKSQSTVALANLQTSSGNGMTAKLDINTVTGTSPDPDVDYGAKIGISTGSVAAASAFTVTGNSMATQVYNNSANNSLALDVTTASQVTAGVVSGQLVNAVSGTELAATTNARIQIESGDVSGASSLTSRLNQITSTTVANAAGNALIVQATTASGRNTAVEGYLPANARNVGDVANGAYAHDASADYAIVNEQLVSGSVLAATTNGNLLASSSGVVTNSSITLSDNTASSYASANNASNALQLDVTNLSAARAGLSNAQLVKSDATVTTATTADATVSTGNLMGAKISANSNQLKSTALGNEATNALRLVGTNASSTATFGAADTRTGSFSDVNADMALASDQTNNGSTLGATVTGSNTVTAGTVANDNTNLSVITANSNSLLAASTVNSVSNTVGLNLQNNLTGMTAGLSSSQTAAESVATATANAATGKVMIDVDAVSGNSSLSVNSNTVSASATANTATNAVNVAAITASGRNSYSTDETALTVSPSANVTADYALANNQAVTGTNKEFKASTQAVTKVLSSDVSSSSVAVNDNSTLASTLGNSATNSIGVTVTNLTQAKTGLASLQTLGDTVSFTSEVNKTTDGQAIGITSDVLTSANLSVNNNVLKASATGNSATNSITQAVTNATGTAIASDKLTLSDTVNSDARAQANVALSSLQKSTGNAITATLGDSEMVPAVSIVSGNVGGTSQLSVVGNTLSTQVFNNSVNNTVVLSGTSLSTMTAGLASGQEVAAVSNTALTATTLATAGINVQTVDTGAQLTASTNTIKSMVVGNSAGNSLTVNATNNASGQNFAGTTADAASTSQSSADFALVSQQVLNGSAMEAKTAAVVGVQAFGVTGSSLTANDNIVSAYTSANNVSNGLSLGIDTLTAARAGLANNQMLGSAATVLATVEGTSVGISSTGDFDAAQISLARNTVKATALGNVADNVLVVAGTNATAGSVSLSGSQANAGASTNVTSGLALANNQASSDQTVTAKNGTDGIWTTIAVTSDTGGLVQNTSNLALTGNTIAALSYANNASNGMGVNVSNLNGLTAGLANTQSSTATATQSVLAETYGRIYADVGTVQDTSTLTLTNNSVSATSMANYAANTLLVNSQQITGNGGTSVNAAANAATPSASVPGDLTLASSQALAGSGDAVTANVTGSIDATSVDLKSANLTVSNNTISAYAAGNNVGNALVVSTSGLSGVVVALGNAQQSLVNATSNSTAYIRGYGSTIDGGQMAVNDNQVKSTAVGNAAGNTLSVTAANATGVSGSPNVDLSQSNAVAYADVNLVNAQNLQGNVQASTGNLGDESAVIKLEVGTEAKATSVLSLNGNAMTASAYGNSATNAGALRISNALSSGSAVGNSQYASGATVSSEIMNGKIFVDAFPLTDTNLSVNNNRIASSAMTNTTANTLAVSAASATGRDGATSISANGVASADHTVGNLQKVSGGAVSSITGGDVVNTMWGGDVSLSNVSQNANAVTSYASANQASNSLSVAVSNLNTGTAGLYSGQIVQSGTTVDAYTAGTVLFTTQDEGSGSIASLTVSLNENLVKSSAFANTATNELLVSGATLQSQVIATNVTAGLSATSAHVGLVNSQTAKGGALTAKTQSTDTDPYTVQLSAGTITSSALSLNANTLAALATNNSADNTLGMSVTNTVGTSIALANGQEATSDASATTRGKVWADVSDLTGGSIAVNSNDINAKAYSNTATNTLTVSGTNYTGSGLNSRSSDGIAGTGPSAYGEIAMTNAQFASANTTEATTVGGMTLATGNLSSAGNTLSMNNNAVTAYASGNAGSNTLGVTQTALNGASAGLVSTQNLATSNVTASTTGTVSIETGALGVAANPEADPPVLSKSASVSIKDNSIKSTALGNVVGNAMVVSATTATNAGPSGVQTSASSAGQASTTADYSMVNAQGAVGDMSATTTGAVSVSSTAVANSSISMTGNAIQSVAQANSGTNRLTLAVDQPTAITAAVASRQDNDGAVSASTTTGTGALSISASSLTQSTDQTLSVVMSGNTVSAAAGKNEAFNTLAVSGANVSGRNNAVSGEVVGTASVTGVDYSVVNAQAATGGVSASVDVKGSGIASSGTVNAGTITLSDNTVLASANANTAGNALTLAATNRLEASGAINNVQTVSTSAISATVESASLTVGTGSGEGSAQVTSTGNLVKATASANLATNALNATASNGITTAGAERGTGMVDPQTPTFAVLNSQHTNAASSVSSVINGFSMGGSALNGALNGGSVAVTGNVIQSLAYGNSANNSVQVSALPATLNTASASITNVQYNLASVSASIAGMNVQASGSNSVSSSGVNISGNTVTAMAVGNRASNVIIGR